MLAEINNYFRNQSCNIGGFENFKKTGLYEFYGNIFGPLIYTEDTSRHFIGVDASGRIYDETYYPMQMEKRAGTIIPKMFHESDFAPVKAAPEWESVARKGYCVLDNIKVEEELWSQAMNEAFIPHGINPELNMSKSIFHAYFATLADYDRPEQHKSPEYMNQITKRCLEQIPPGNFHVNNYLFHTADIVKYLYDPSDEASTHGPYSFHMDFFSRLHYMFFIYFSKKSPIEGRELLVGKRDDFLDFSEQALDLSPAEQPDIPSPFESVGDEMVKEHDSIKIKHGTVVLMNTLNPMMVHKVNKLRSDNEVVLMTNYCWSDTWPSVD